MKHLTVPWYIISNYNFPMAAVTDMITDSWNKTNLLSKFFFFPHTLILAEREETERMELRVSDFMAAFQAKVIPNPFPQLRHTDQGVRECHKQWASENTERKCLYGLRWKKLLHQLFIYCNWFSETLPCALKILLLYSSSGSDDAGIVRAALALLKT